MANTPLYKTFTLKLVSPHMKDGRGPLKGTHLIRDLQYMLHGASKNARNKNKSWGEFYKVSLDGEYGPVTASAVHLAKWLLGYPTKEVNSVAGPVLQAYLRGEKKIPLTYVARRNARLRAMAAADTIRIKAAAKAATQIGVHESPFGSNRVLYSQWYGIIGSWCAMFVTWCNVMVGGKRFQKGNRYAYVPYVVADARAGRNGLHLTSAPQRGDLVCYDWTHDGTADHIGYFDAWIDEVAGTFHAIEGNTSAGNFSNGGAVERTTRYRYQVQAFVRVVEP